MLRCGGNERRRLPATAPKRIETLMKRLRQAGAPAKEAVDTRRTPMVALTRPEGTLPEDLHLSRRSFASLVSAGYAAFASAAEAAPVTTPIDGLAIASVSLPGGLPAYVARPAGRARHAAIIVVSEVFGLHEYIRDICRRLARAGYVAIAPEFFFRHDPDRTLATSTDFPAIMRIVSQARNDQVMGDLRTTLDWLAMQDFADARHLGITGFCWGGAVTWMAAARFPQLAAGVAWYGRLCPPKPGQPIAEARRWPIEVVNELHAPVLGLYGALDKGIPVADVAAMQAALRAAGTAGSSIMLYPDADHGFHADYRASYNARAAADGWSRMLSHFRSYGIGTSRG
jgi:carboxymethylenebutenolidase